jgi:hypothetical protein
LAVGELQGVESSLFKLGSTKGGLEAVN